MWPGNQDKCDYATQLDYSRVTLLILQALIPLALPSGLVFLNQQHSSACYS